LPRFQTGRRLLRWVGSLVKIGCKRPSLLKKVQAGGRPGLVGWNILKKPEFLGSIRGEIRSQVSRQGVAVYTPGGEKGCHLIGSFFIVSFRWCNFEKEIRKGEGEKGKKGL